MTALDWALLALSGAGLAAAGYLAGRLHQQRLDAGDPPTLVRLEVEVFGQNVSTNVSLDRRLLDALVEACGHYTVPLPSARLQ